MIIKDGASINGLHIEMRKVLIAADKIWKEHGQNLVITAGLDGVHSPGSLHYYGYAVDFRTRYFPTEVAKKVAHKLRTVLGTDYDVILHKTHIHVEYDLITKK